MSIKRNAAGFTLVEMMIATAVGVLAIGALMSLTAFSNMSFASTANYCALDLEGQITLDRMSQEIRQAKKVTACTSTNISLQNADGTTIQYTFDPTARSLVRSKSGFNTTNLSDCDSLFFSIYQRAPESNTFQAISETSITTNTKMVQITWTCSRKVMNGRVNSDSVQSAKIVLRNK
jgi:Tfp pilus assembly protein PilE